MRMIIIKFAVNRTWMTANARAFSNISLYRWSSERWNELPRGPNRLKKLQAFRVPEKNFR